MKDFLEWGCAVFPTFRLWDMFLLAASIMLQNIRAERNGIWSMYLSSVRSMLPFFFVTNRNNYSRWTPIYLLDMLNLPSKVESRFKAGFFAIRQKAGSFNGVWSDMATEKTIIKDSKSNGGIVGLARKKSALIRWTITRHIVGHFSAAMKVRSASMKWDEQQVADLISHLQENIINPFDI